nr:F-box domain containing protein [Pandoravirus belohorizontensis]
MYTAAQTDLMAPTADVAEAQPTVETRPQLDDDALFSRRARKRHTERAPEEEEARPRQRRRTRHAPADLISLPSELVVAVALWLDPVDLARAGATCRRLAEIAADQPLWRHVFGRLYGSALYAGSAAGVMVAYEPLRETRHADSPSSSPPLPFAHMIAAGRDWRWLCLVHDAEARCRRDSPTPGSPPDKACVRYASPPGSRNADYAVEIRRDAGGHLAAWVEAVWAPSDGAPQPRAVLARADHRAHFAADAATVSSALGGDADAEGITRGRIVNRAGRMLYEGACRHGLAHGHGVVTDAGGRRWKAVSRDGTTLSTTLRPADGHVEEIVVRCVVPPQGGPQGQQPQQPRVHDARAGRRHTSAALTVRYANGDRLHMLHTAHARAALFWCSPDCPDRRFAARRIECRSWAQALDIDALALWPLDEPGDDPDDPVRLFVDYVRGGHCGWGPEAQRHAERMDALGARALLDGRAGSDVPYAVVRSDDAQVAAARFFFETLP